VAGRRSYTDADLVVAAKEVFWDRGYEGTTIDHLQAATGLSRSSLYLVFDTKRALLDAALAEYVASFTDVALHPVEAPEAGLPEAAAFFRGLASYFRRADAQRGCLFINTIAELSGRDPSFSPVAAAFASRLRAAFTNALGNAAAGGAMSRKHVARRAELLAVAVLGVWLSVRSDTTAAATTCRFVAQEITSWDASPAA
jgi:TetR/AcrR family transcriptional repressor of nem operon